MYTIKMNQDKSLTRTVCATIYEGENLVDKIQFLIPETYDSVSLADFDVFLTMNYPDEEPCIRKLYKLEEQRNKQGWMRYRIDVDQEITRMHGDVIVWLSFHNHEGRALQSGQAVLEISPKPFYNKPNPPEEDEPTGGIPVVIF